MLPVLEELLLLELLLLELFELPPLPLLLLLLLLLLELLEVVPPVVPPVVVPPVVVPPVVVDPPVVLTGGGSLLRLRDLGGLVLADRRRYGAIRQVEIAEGRDVGVRLDAGLPSST